MGAKGAKNLIILSRSGSFSSEARDIIAEIAASGIRIEAPPCDTTGMSTLRQVLDSTASHLPPIKGCIQAAMVIQDSLFASITHSEWTTALAPKINGSWNLHSVLPFSLDFFIMLSSTSKIIGSGGQSNYSAGNTYQDALAAYRVAQGEKSVSLDLSVMADAGYFIDHKDALDQYLSIKKLTPMRQKQLFTVLERFCDPELKIDDMKSQVVMGLSLPADVKSRGKEGASWMEEPLFRHLHQIESANAAITSANSSSSTPAQADLSSLATAKTHAEASSIITHAVSDKLARVLSCAPADIDTSKPMHAHGVDSLVAVEPRNWFLKSLKTDVPIFEILGNGAIDALGGSVAEKMGVGKGNT